MAEVFEMNEEAKSELGKASDVPDDPTAGARLRKHDILVKIATLLGRPLEDFFTSENQDRELHPTSTKSGSNSGK